MRKKDKHKSELRVLFDSWLQTHDAEALISYLTQHSDLPGRRANLELAAAFGDFIEQWPSGPKDALWELLDGMAAISADQAPVNTPQEFIPFCSAVGMGALGSRDAARQKTVLLRLRALANDPRWRMREAVCFGLQRLLNKRPTDTLQALGGWIPEGTPLELRAAVAAVAEPVLLQDHSIAIVALELHRRVIDHVLKTPQRKTEAFKTLRKALGYTLSVVVYALPQLGFEYIAQLALVPDPDLQWIVEQNLKKNRLAKHFPEQVEAAARMLADRKR